MSETMTCLTSVPSGSDTVKLGLADLLNGLPLTASECGVKLSQEITSTEFARGLGLLYNAEKRVTVVVRFKVGDMWNQIHQPEFSKARMEWLAGLDVRLTQQQKRKYLKRLRDCGWVANKWPDGSRNTNRPWRFYVDNAPGSPLVKSKPYGAEALTLADCVETGSGMMLHLTATHDREFMAECGKRVKVRWMDGREEVCDIIIRPVAAE